MLVIDKIMYYLVSLIKDTFSVVKEKPLYNEDFMSKFSDPSDMEKLLKAIREMKQRKGDKTRTIKLNNGETITIAI